MDLSSDLKSIFVANKICRIELLVIDGIVYVKNQKLSKYV